MKHPNKAVKFSLTGILLLGLFILLNIRALAQSNPDLSHITNADSLFTQAEIALSLNRNIPKAQRLFERVAELQPTNAEAHARLALILQYQKKGKPAMRQIKKALKTDADNKDYLKTYAHLLIENKKYKEALKPLDRLIKTADDPSDFLLKKAFCYKKLGQYQDALDALSKVSVNSKEAQEGLLQDKLKIFSHLSKPDSVAAMANKLIKINPNKPKYYLMVAYMAFKNQQTNKGLNVLDSALLKFPQKPKVVEAAITAFVQYDSVRLKNFYNYLINTDRYSPQQKTILFYPLITKHKTSAIANRIILKKLPQLAFGKTPNKYAILLYGGFAIDNKGLKDGVKILKKGIHQLNGDMFLWKGLLELFQQTGHPDSLAVYSNRLMKKYPKNRVPFFYRSLVDFNNGDTMAAVGHLKTAYQNKHSDTLIEDFNIVSFLGNIYQTMRRPDSAEKYFIKALKIHPDAPVVMNNYSYLLATQGKDLQKAEDLSAQVIKMYPHEATYLDTYGWILYKRKEYKKAKVYLQMAIYNMPQPDAVLYEHLGDVEAALGNAKEAKKNWQKAVNAGGSSFDLLNKISK